MSIKRSLCPAVFRILCILGLLFLSSCATKKQDTDEPNHRLGNTPGHHSVEEASEAANQSIDLAENDLAYLTQLGLMRGHLLVGYQLYFDGYIEHAKTHMKHPESELYSKIEPAFKARGSEGFAVHLQQLAQAVETEQDQATVTSFYRTLVVAIGQSENKVSLESHSTGTKLQLAAELLMVANEEYAIAVVDGKMENAHEYQDAYGFTEIAKEIVGSIEPMGDQPRVMKAVEMIESLAPLWPSLIPPNRLSTSSQALELIAKELKDI